MTTMMRLLPCVFVAGYLQLPIALCQERSIHLSGNTYVSRRGEWFQATEAGESRIFINRIIVRSIGPLSSALETLQAGMRGEINNISAEMFGGYRCLTLSDTNKAFQVLEVLKSSGQFSFVGFDVGRSHAKALHIRHRRPFAYRLRVGTEAASGIFIIHK